MKRLGHSITMTRIFLTKLTCRDIADLITSYLPERCIYSAFNEMHHIFEIGYQFPNGIRASYDWSYKDSQGGCFIYLKKNPYRFSIGITCKLVYMRYVKYKVRHNESLNVVYDDHFGESKIAVDFKKIYQFLLKLSQIDFDSDFEKSWENRPSLEIKQTVMGLDPISCLVPCKL